jgi:anti-sigma B factor antagonist
MKMTTTTRQVGFVAIVDISGQIVLGKESASLRSLISDLLSTGHKKILLNLANVERIDTAGLAYIISALKSVRMQEGELKLLNPTKHIQDVLELTKLYTVFDIREDEAAALRSFGESDAATA